MHRPPFASVEVTTVVHTAIGLGKVSGRGRALCLSELLLLCALASLRWNIIQHLEAGLQEGTLFKTQFPFFPWLQDNQSSSLLPRPPFLPSLF
jgi:hypothetical protein